MMSARPTLLRVLVAQRHWQRYETFATQFGHAAEALADKDHDPGLRGLSIAKRQFTRWLAGTVKTKPYPDHCRVLEYLFGRSVEELLSPISPESEPTQVLAHPAPPLARMSVARSTPAVVIDRTTLSGSGETSLTATRPPGSPRPPGSTGADSEEAASQRRMAASGTVVAGGRVRLEWGRNITRVELPGIPWDTIVELSEVGGGLQRRILVKVGGLLVAEALLSRIDTERLIWARSNPSKIDLDFVGDLRAITFASVEKIHRASPVEHLAPMRSHLEYLTGLLEAGPPTPPNTLASATRTPPRSTSTTRRTHSPTSDPAKNSSSSPYGSPPAWTRTQGCAPSCSKTASRRSRRYGGR